MKKVNNRRKKAAIAISAIVLSSMMSPAVSSFADTIPANTNNTTNKVTTNYMPVVKAQNNSTKTQKDSEAKVIGAALTSKTDYADGQVVVNSLHTQNINFDGEYSKTFTTNGATVPNGYKVVKTTINGVEVPNVTTYRINSDKNVQVVDNNGQVQKEIKGLHEQGKDVQVVYTVSKIKESNKKETKQVQQHKQVQQPKQTDKKINEAQLQQLRATNFAAITNENLPIRALVTPNIYTNVQYSQTLDEYVAGEIQNYMACLGVSSLSQSQIQELTNAINPEDSKVMYQFLKVNTFRNVNEQALANLLQGKGVFSGQAQAFIGAARKYNLDPVYFLSQSALETGWGTSNFANGITITQIANTNAPIYNSNGVIVGYQMINLPHPTTVYNLYGIGAYDANASFPNKTTILGTTYAYNHGWTSISNAIYGAAQFLSVNYIHNTNIAQNTPYELRYINAPNDDMWHQYASDIHYGSLIGSIIEQNKWVYAPGDTFTFAIPQFASSSSSGMKTVNETGNVNVNPGSSLNVRSGASTSDSIIGSLQAGAQVTIIGKVNGWDKIVYNGGVGYVYAEYINNVQTNTPNSEINVTPLNMKGVIDFSGGPFTYITSRPDWNNSGVGSLYNGTEVTITGEYGSWYRINYNGGSAWVCKDRVDTQIKSLNMQGIVDFSGGPFTYITRQPNWNNSGVGSLYNGTEVTITGEYGNWYRINYNGGSAWICKDRVDTQIKSLNMQGIVDFAGGPFTYITRQPNWNNSGVGSLYNGDAVTITGEYGNWYRINYNGGSAWICKDRVDTNIKILNMQGTVDFKGGPFTYITSKPNWNNSGVAPLYNGTQVTITGEFGNWYRINYKGGSAWICKDRVQTMPTSGVVNFGGGDFTYITRHPNWDNDGVGALYNGTEVKIISESGSWYEIDYNGGTAWICKDRVDTSGNFLMNKVGTVDFKGGPFTYITRHPNWNNDGVGYLNNGTKVTVTGQLNGWYRINYNGGSAWICKDRVSFN